MGSKQIGYGRVSTRRQDTQRQEDDLVAAGVRPDDLYLDFGVSGSVASRPELERAIRALQPGDVFVVTTLDRLVKRRAAGMDLGGRRQLFTPSQIRNAQRLISAGESPSQVAKDLGMSRATLYRRLSK